MSKKEMIVLEGIVTEALPNAMFRVMPEGFETPILCYISGKIRINLINIYEGDKVKIEMSPYDLTKGRITYLLKDKKNSDR